MCDCPVCVAPESSDGECGVFASFSGVERMHSTSVLPLPSPPIPDLVEVLRTPGGQLPKVWAAENSTENRRPHSRRSVSSATLTKSLDLCVLLTPHVQSQP